MRGEAGYDRMLRLTSASRPSGNFAATGGPYASRAWAYDGRGNRLPSGGEQVDGCSNSLSYGSESRPDQVVERVSSCDGTVDYRYTWAPTGALFEKNWAGNQNGIDGQLRFYYFMTNGPFGGTESVYKTVSVNGGFGWWSMMYDAYNRRTQKQSPLADQFSYTYYSINDNTLLTDVGQKSPTQAQPYVGDDYVWLDGKALAVVRYAWTMNGANQTVLEPELQGDCMRDGESRACGVYFLVSDYLPKPVLMLNSDMRVVGTGEYEPFGTVNRTSLVAGTAHPYGNTQSGSVIADIAPVVSSNTAMQVRARVHLVDTESGGGVTNDFAKLTDSSGNALSSFAIGGYQSGPVVTPWVTVPNDGHVNLRFYSDGQNCCPFNGELRCGPQNYCDDNYPYRGVTLEAFEYRRSEVYGGGTQVAAPAWVPLRMPGQYYDEETDLHENWSRYYDPAGGNYVHLEPILSSPRFVRSKAIEGLSVDAYSYANNNPLGYVDSDGNHTRQYRRDGKGNEVVRALEAPLRSSLIEQCKREAEKNEKQCQEKDPACREPAPLPPNPSVPDLRARDEAMIKVLTARDGCIKGANCEYEACLAGATSASGTADYMRAWSKCMSRP